VNRNPFRYLTGNIRVLALTDMLGNFARNAVFPYASLYILALGGNAAQIGFVNFIALSTGLLMLPVAGFITDRADRVRLLAFSGFLSSLFLGLVVVAPTWQLVAVAFFLYGSVVFQFPAYASLVADSLAPGDRGRGLGLMNTVSSSISILAPYLAGLIIEYYTADLGMRLLYAGMLIIYLASALIQLRFLKEDNPEGHGKVTLAGLVEALTRAYARIPGLLGLMPTPLKALAWVVLLSFLANAAAGPFWVVYATEQIGLTPAQWGLILLVQSVAGLLGFLPSGWIADHWGRTRTLLASLVISLVAVPLFVLAHSFLAALAIRVALSLAFVLALPAGMALMADLTPRRQRGEIMAAIGQGGIMLAPPGGGVGGPALGYLFIPPVMLASLAGGWLYTLHPAYPWVFSTLVTLISIVLVLIYLRDPHEAEV
jgi:MFS transporter, DHA1 family, quinolone resistance protein